MNLEKLRVRFRMIKGKSTNNYINYNDIIILWNAHTKSQENYFG